MSTLIGTAKEINAAMSNVSGDIWDTWSKEQSETLTGRIDAVLGWKNLGTDGDLSDNDREVIRGLRRIAEHLDSQKQISISMDGVWAGSGVLRNGTIENCGAQFCDDNDESLAAYDRIEEAIAKGRDHVVCSLAGEPRKLTWSIVDND